MASGSPIRNCPLLASIYKKHTARGFLVQPLVEAYRPRMVDNPDIWRAANLLVKRHGDDAVLTAVTRADEMLAAGDVEGCAIWKRILGAVAELTRTKSIEGERVN